MKLRRISAEFRSNTTALGLWITLRALVLRAIQRVIHFKVLRAMYVTAVDPTFAAVPSGVIADFLDEATLRRMASDAKYDLSPEFLDEALGKGDECYGILDGTEPVAYGWYARRPTRISDELRLHFDDAYVYMYKGLTLDAYRGRRLHAIGMTRALAAYRARGFKGLVTYIEADNLNSLKSSYRMGYVDFGRVYIIRVLGRYVTLRTPGCAAFGFDVVPERGNGDGAHRSRARQRAHPSPP